MYNLVYLDKKGNLLNFTHVPLFTTNSPRVEKTWYYWCAVAEYLSSGLITCWAKYYDLVYVALHYKFLFTLDWIFIHPTPPTHFPLVTNLLYLADMHHPVLLEHLIDVLAAPHLVQRVRRIKSLELRPGTGSRASKESRVERF